MSALLWNVMLAVAWTAVTGDLSAANLALGLVLGFAVLASTRQAIGAPRYPNKLRGVMGLLLFFLWELLLSNVRVARDVLRPRTRIHPAVVAVPLEARSDAEITLLAGLISLTPGSTSIDVSPDRRLLFVHVVNIEGSSAEAEVRELKAGFERRLLEVMR